MLKSMHHAKEQSPVSHRNYNIGRDAVKLLINLINVGFSSLIEERIVNMVGIIDTFMFNLFPAHICTMVSGTWNNGTCGAMGTYHVYFLGTCSVLYKDLTFNSCLGAISCNRVPGIAA